MPVTGRLLLHETPWFGVELMLPTVPTRHYPRGRLVMVNQVDMRLEDMKRYGGVPVRDIYNWLAPIPHDGEVEYLTHDHGVIQAGWIPEIGAETWTVLPETWWEYALGNFDGKIVKAPRYPRGGEPTQEELDTQHGVSWVEPAQRVPAVSESYQRRLDRVLGWPF